MPENRSGFPQIKYRKKISLWKKLKFGLKTAVFQSSVLFCMLDLIRLTAYGRLIGRVVLDQWSRITNLIV
jgi:hypothetical protein